VPVFPKCCTRGRWPSPSAWLPRVSCPFRHSGKPLFPECYSSPSATLGEEWLPQVPDFWHSGKHLALGEFCFSRSDCRAILWFLACITLVESEPFVRAFSPGSTLEPGLKAFRWRGPKYSLETPPFSPGWYNQPWQKGYLPMAFSRNDWRGLLAPGGITHL
jgi:hypothetical protein